MGLLNKQNKKTLTTHTLNSIASEIVCKRTWGDDRQNNFWDVLIDSFVHLDFHNITHKRKLDQWWRSIFPELDNEVWRYGGGEFFLKIVIKNITAIGSTNLTFTLVIELYRNTKSYCGWVDSRGIKVEIPATNEFWKTLKRDRWPDLQTDSKIIRTVKLKGKSLNMK